MKKKIIIIVCLLVLAAEIFLAIKLEPDMSGVGANPPKITQVAGYELPMGGLNQKTMIATWIIMLGLIASSFLATRKLTAVPGRLQCFYEMLLEMWDKICKDTLGDKGRFFMPYITTIFLLVLCCNWIGIIPLWFIHEPTQDLNTTLALGLIAFIVSHIAAIRYCGVKKYIYAYFEPWIEIKGLKIPNIPFGILAVVGEIGKLVSHSFRLFGNILGGAIIIQVVSNLTRFFILPVGLNGFFGIFVGAIQAFVFAMLALVYIAVLVEQ